MSTLQSQLAAVATALSLATPLSATAADVPADLRMAADAAPFRQVADAFIGAAMAGKLDAVQAQLSPNLVQRTGSEAVRAVLERQIVPFFSAGQRVGPSVTITHTTDANGYSGFAFYMWMLPRQGGDARPFTLYVVEEQGRRVVANIVPDRLVAGRHR